MEGGVTRCYILYYLSTSMDLLFLPRDVIACLTLGGGFLLLALGYDGVVGSMMMAVTLFYFGVDGLKGRKKS